MAGGGGGGGGGGGAGEEWGVRGWVLPLFLFLCKVPCPPAHVPRPAHDPPPTSPVHVPRRTHVPPPTCPRHVPGPPASGCW